MLTDKWSALGGWSPLKALQRVGETKWLIDGVIPAGSINWMVASPSSFKTFLALDMGTCIASGRPWHGRETDQALVLYIAGEGDDDIHVRRAAADMAAGDTGPLCIVQTRPRLDEPTGLASLLGLVESATGAWSEMADLDEYWKNTHEKYLTPKQLERYYESLSPEVYAEKVARHLFSPWEEAICAAVKLVETPMDDVIAKLPKNIFLVVDTYSQTSADDAKGTVSRYIKTLRDLQDKVAAIGRTVTVLVIDHTTKSGDSYMGSLAKEGDSDTMLEVDRHGDSYAVTLKSLKLRGGAPFTPIHLELEPITLGGFTDALDRPLRSLSVVDGEQDHRIRKAAGVGKDSAAALMIGLLAEDDTNTAGTLRQKFIAHPSNKGKDPDTVSRAFRRAINSLAAGGLILTDAAGAVAMAPGTRKVVQEG